MRLPRRKGISAGCCAQMLFLGSFAEEQVLKRADRNQHQEHTVSYGTEKFFAFIFGIPAFQTPSMGPGKKWCQPNQ